jgi:hypothetical protein
MLPANLAVFFLASHIAFCRFLRDVLLIQSSFHKETRNNSGNLLDWPSKQLPLSHLPTSPFIVFRKTFKENY